MKGRNGEITAAGTSGAWDAGGPPQLSVMLPTCRRPDALARTLAGLEQQSLPPESFEIVVVDDGSRDGTETLLAQFAARTAARFSYEILAENGGPARARNFGLARCRGRAVLILGDDIEPDPELVRIHCEFHRDNPAVGAALLGRVSFPDESAPTPFMRWLETGGRSYFFNFADLTPGEPAGPMFFYTCNVSVKTALLDKSGWFDESFPYASHEDLELGHRLAEQGMRLVYEPRAAGYHWHQLNIQGVARRIYLMGYSAELFWRKVGDRGGPARRILRVLITRLAASTPAAAAWKRLRKKDYSDGGRHAFQWHVLLFLSFFIGLADSTANREPRV